MTSLQSKVEVVPQQPSTAPPTTRVIDSPSTHPESDDSWGAALHDTFSVVLYESDIVMDILVIQELLESEDERVYGVVMIGIFMLPHVVNYFSLLRYCRSVAPARVSAVVVFGVPMMAVFDLLSLVRRTARKCFPAKLDAFLQSWAAIRTLTEATLESFPQSVVWN